MSSAPQGAAAVGWGEACRPAALLPKRLLVVLLVVLGIWGLTDVRSRGAVNPGNIYVHKTDLTVYTEAGRAFFDGRDPYEVTNPRGWGYLYPPLFAMLLAPLSALAPQQQVVVWFVVCVGLVWGCYYESVRIAQLVLNPADLRTRRAARWIGYAALAAFALPTLNCLQRGQIGVVKLYLLLAGLRLILEKGSLLRSLAGGAVLALPIVFKITPIVPVAYLVVQHFAGALKGPGDPLAMRRAVAVAAGVAGGLVLWLLIVPSMLVGPTANLRHLHTWWTVVGTKASNPSEDSFAGNSRSVRNQSLLNATYLLSQSLNHGIKRSEDLRQAATAEEDVAMQHRSPNASATTMPAAPKTPLAKVMLIVRLAASVLVLCLGYVLGRRENRLAQVAGFGLAAAATLVVSPISRVHYFMLLLPAIVYLPLWLIEQGRSRAAAIVALVPVVLLFAHYLALSIAGPLGLLGIGSSIWFFAGCGILLAGNRATAVLPEEGTVFRAEPAAPRSEAA